MSQKIISQGAEAIIILQNNEIIKRRIKKSYRIPFLDEKLRKTRTKKETKLLNILKGKINIPKLIKINEKEKEIIMEFIPGKRLSEFLDPYSNKEQENICKQIGNQLAIIHNLNIIHGDLTTSNMIFHNNKIFLIDFGLGQHSTKIEDKAVDLHLLKQALEAKHFKNFKFLFEKIIENYNPEDKAIILLQLEKVEKRGRYKH